VGRRRESSEDGRTWMRRRSRKQKKGDRAEDGGKDT